MFNLCTFILILFAIKIHLNCRITSLRVYVCFWWIFCTLVANIYKGSFIAFLNVSSQPPAINTLKELTESKFGWCQGSSKDALYELLKTSDVRNLFIVMGTIKYYDYNDTD